MADFNFQEWANSQLANRQGGGYPQSYNGQGMAWQDFYSKYNQLAQANQLIQNGQIDDYANRSRQFQMNGGTEGLFNNRYRKANVPDYLAIKSLEAGEFFNNLPGVIAGALGGDKAKEDWTFDANKFDLSNGLDTSDLEQVRNFAVSIPGMIPGGIFEGLGKAYEGITGAPVQERRETKDGYEIADYELDASQRAAAGLDAAINLFGTATGGAGRLVGGATKFALKRAAKEAGETIEEMAARGITRETAQEQATRDMLSKASNIVEKNKKRQDLIEGMSKGWVTRALEAGKKGEPLSTGAGLFADMAEEASEEFVQSYADDVRMKNIDDGSFDRALTGAAWGAAGGLLMGGAGRLLGRDSNTNANEEIEENAQDPEQTNEYTSIKLNPAFAQMARVADENRDSIIANDNFIQGLEDAHQLSTKAAGSTIVTQNKPDDTMAWDEFGTGTNTIVAVFDRDEASARRIANLFGTDVETMRTAVRQYKQNVEGFNFAAWLQAKIDAKIEAGGRFATRCVIGRNPDTKNGGFYLNLTKIYDGRGYSARPEVMTLVGSDWDSDKCSVYFYDPRNLAENDEGDEDARTENVLAVRGYPSQILSDPERHMRIKIKGEDGGAETEEDLALSNLDWDWAGIGKGTGLNEELMEEILSRYLDDEKVRKYMKRFREAFARTDKDEKHGMFSSILSDILAEQDELFRQDSRNRSGHNVVTDILNDISNEDYIFIQERSQAPSNAYAVNFARAMGVDESTSEGQQLIEEFEDRMENLEKRNYVPTSRGTTPDESFSAMADAIGFVSFIIDKSMKINPGFRQFGALKYWINNTDLASEAIRYLSTIYNADANIIQTIIMEAFKIAAPTMDPTYAIETLCDNLLMAQVYENTNMAGERIKSRNGLQILLREFIRAQSRYSRLYNKSQEQETNEGDKVRPDSAYRNPLDDRRTGQIDSTFEGDVPLDYRGHEDLWRNFIRIFGDAELGRIFDDTIIRKIGYPIQSTTTINEFLDWADSKFVSGDVEIIASSLESIDHDIAQFFRNIHRAKGSEKTAIARGFESVVDSIDLNGVEITEDGAIKDPHDLEQVLALFDLIYEYVGYNNAIRMGFVLTDKFFSTEIGQKLLTGDTKTRMNIIVKMTIYGQYMDDLSVLMDPNLDEESQEIKNAEQNIRELSLISPLHQFISNQILQKNYEAFNWATDLNMTLEESRNQLKDIFPSDSDADFIVNGLQTEMGQFTLSSISAKNRKAQNLSAKMLELSYEARRQEVENLRSRMHALGVKNNSNALVRFGRYQWEHVIVSYNSDIAALNVIAATRLENSQVEKATSQEIRGKLYTLAEQEKDGSLMSLLNRVTAYYSGSMNANAWLGNRAHMLSCLFDSSYKCFVFDPRQGKSVLMTQETLLRSAGITEFDGNLTDAHIFAVLEKYPQLAGYLSTPFSKITSRGSELDMSMKRDQTVSNAFDDWYTKYEKAVPLSNQEDDVKDQYYRSIDKIKGWIQTSPSYQKILAAYLSKKNPKIFSGRINTSEVIRESRKCLDALARDIFWDINHRTAEDQIREGSLERRLGVEKALVRDLYSVIELANEAISSEMGTNEQERIGSYIASNLTTSMLIDFLNDEVIEDGNYEISFEDVFNREGLLESLADKIGCDISLIEDLYAAAVYIKKEEAKSSVSVQAEGTFATIDTSYVKARLENYFYSKTNDYDEAKKQAQAVLEQSKVDSWRFDLDRVKFGEVFIDEELFSKNDFTAFRKILKDKLGLTDTEALNEWQSLTALNKTEREKKLKRLNARIIDNLITRLDRRLATRTNHNAANMMLDVADAVDSLYEEVREKASNHDDICVGAMRCDHMFEVATGSPHQEFDYTELSFDDPRAQSIYTIAELEAPAGGGPIKVGMNGSDQKFSGPLGHLSKDLTDDPNLSYGTYKTAAEIQTMRVQSDYSSIKALITVPGENGQMTEKYVALSSEYMTSYLNSVNPGERIMIFDPEENAHGLPTFNMLPSTGTDPTGQFHRLSGIWQRFIQFSMEELVLKYKKKMDPDGVISDPNATKQMGAELRTVRSDFSYANLRKRFRNCRTDFINFLTSEFTNKQGQLKSLGYDRDQARIMAQSITPGYLVEFEVSWTDEEGNTQKELVSRFLDSSLFVGDEAQAEERFNTAMEVIRANISAELGIQGEAVVEFKRADVYFCTFAELNRRLAVAIDMHKDNDGKISPGNAEQEANKAMSDWSDYYLYCNGDVASLMYQVPPVSVSNRYEAIPTTSNKTPFQLARDIELGIRGSNGDLSTRHTREFLPSEHCRLREVAETFRKQGQVSGLSGNVIKVWKKKPHNRTEDIISGSSLTNEINAGSLLDTTKASIAGSGYNPDNYVGSAILWDDDETSIREAILWAGEIASEHSNDYVYIKEDVFNNRFKKYKQQSGVAVLEISGVKFIPLHVSDAVFREAIKYRTPSSSSGPQSRSEISLTIVVPRDSVLAQDHPEFKSLADGSVGVFYSNKGLQVDHPEQIAEYSYDSLFGEGRSNVYEKQFMTREQARVMRDQIARWDDASQTWVPVDPETWSKEGLGKPYPISLDTPHTRNLTKANKLGKGTNQIAEDVIVFLNKIIDDNRDTESDEAIVAPDRLHSNEIMTMMFNGEFFVPVYSPSTNLPTNISVCSFDRMNGELVFSYSGSTAVYELDSGGLKFSINAPNEAFKGMGFLMPEGFSCTTSGRATGKSFDIGYAIASESENSRVGGIESRLLADALYYRMILEENMNLFYERTPDGYKLKQNIIDCWPEYLIKKFKTGTMTSDDWLKVANVYGVFKGKSRAIRKKNELVCGVIREIANHHPMVSPEEFFGGFSCIERTDKDGTSRLKRISYQPKGISEDIDSYNGCDHRTILRNFLDSKEDLLILFNAVDERLCPEGIGKNPMDRDQYIIWEDGTTWVRFSDQDPGSAQLIRYGNNTSLGVVMAEMPDINVSAVSDQHIIARGSDIGYDQHTIGRALSSENIQFGLWGRAYKEYQDNAERKKYQRKAQRPRVPLPIELDIMSRLPYCTNQDLKRYARVVELDKKTFTKPRMFFDNNGETVTMLEATRGDAKVPKAYRDALAHINQHTASGMALSYHDLDCLLMCLKAVTYTDNMDMEKNVWTVPPSRYVDDTAKIVRALENLSETNGLLITAGSDESADPEGRYKRCLLPRPLAGLVWNTFPALKEYWNGDFNAWVDAMKHEQRAADQAIDNCADKIRRDALAEMSQAAWYSWGESSSVTPLINGGMTAAEAAEYNKTMAARFAKEFGWTKEDQALYIQLCEATDEKIVALQKRYEEINVKRLKYGVEGETQTRVYTRAQEAKDLVNIANAAAETSQVMALLNPLVFEGNLIDRTICQSGMRAWIWLGNKLRIGPYKSDPSHIVAKDIRTAACNYAGSAELYAALRDAEYRSLDMPFVLNLVDNGRVDEAIAYIKNNTPGGDSLLDKSWGKVKDIAWLSASGGNIGIKTQMGLVIDRFVMFVEENEVLSKYWFAPSKTEKRVNGEPVLEDGKPVYLTHLEEVLLSQGFSGLMKECLRHGSASYSPFMKAMNSAKRGDMAQKNAVGLILSDLCRRVGFGNFFMTTVVSRFPTYSLNVTGRALNYLLPMSSINYAFTNFLAKTDYGKALGVEETQIHKSMKEAMMADIVKLGVTGTALVLFGLSGAIQPPDDERKWGNMDEWLVFGSRVSENWWIEDVLGMALPMACFWKACSIGKPRIDILMNGLSNFCWSNPVVKCGDVVSWMINPAESIWTDYEKDKEYFKNSRGGAPSFGEWLQANGFNATMNWATQFITPSILTELYRSSVPYEKSYKRKWASSASGATTENGLYGQTELRSYDDAMKHKLTQHNPVLAYLASTLFNEDYLLENMPNTVMYDDYQLDATRGTSIAGLSDDLKMAKVADIISVLSGVDDVDAFVKQTGFHLDKETLNAVASQVWDMYHEADTWYNNLQASGQLNYLTLGNGDWDEGKRIAAELKNERDNIKQYWYDFYNDKLKNSTIGTTITMYNRYNTTYATDVNGEIYATGIHRSPFNVLPVNIAPGTVDNPEGTAGYENDFASISAVTGLPLDSRALVPIVATDATLPAFKEMSADKNGNSYSQQYIDTYGSSGSLSSSYPSSSYPSGSYRSSGGGGGGGGGGSSYVPNIYAPNTSLPRANISRIMNVDRIYRPDFDYLRPDFETKGSREAYKRSDI